MANRIVVGTQWGDEGKAKIVDALARDSDVIVRFSGGANAGHTVVVGGETFILHLIPSGILYPEKICILGNGTVIDPIAFLKEIDYLNQRGISLDGRMFISDRAHLVFSYHKLLEQLWEKQDSKIGTTMRGIGPAYADKISRKGIRAVDFINKKRFHDIFMANADWIRQRWNLSDESALSENALNEYSKLVEKFSKYVIDVTSFIDELAAKKKSLLFESAQGTFLDIDHGTYPYVTSSNPIAANACLGTGFSMMKIDEIIGVAKAYTTRVGNGPFPTELYGDAGSALREAGGEFGATTGRPRRCGWLDLVMLRRSSILNGLTSLAITKVDVFSSLKQLRVCTDYIYQGKVITGYPADLDIIENCKPVYKEVAGWSNDLTCISSFDALPLTTKDYLQMVSEECGVPVSIVSVGKKRKETIFV